MFSHSQFTDIPLWFSKEIEIHSKKIIDTAFLTTTFMNSPSH